jgi:hypothetical protein
MKFHLLAAGAFACLCVPAFAAECQFEFDDTVIQLPAAGIPVALIEAADLQDIVEKVEALSGEEYGVVTRGFFAQDNGELLLGLEVDGCLLPKIILSGDNGNVGA